MKATILIPCIWGHFQYLDRVLYKILLGTELPDQVAIAITPVETEKKRRKIELLRKKYKKLNITIITREKKLSAPLGANLLTEEIIGDIILIHAADDTQHPQRVEIVKRLFNDFDIMHLCHTFRFTSEGEAPKINYKDISIIETDVLYKRYFIEKKYPNYFGYPFMRNVSHAFSMRKKVLEKVSYKSLGKKGEDREFCLRALKEFNKSILVQAPLYNYNNPILYYVSKVDRRFFPFIKSILKFVPNSYIRWSKRYLG